MDFRFCLGVSASLSMLDFPIRDMRGIITNLSPKSLMENGYLRAVEEFVRGISTAHEVEFDLSMHGMERRFDPEFENSLFRITQELINNTLKYSKAVHVNLNVVGSDRKVVIMYEDDGIGFSPDKINRGYGLNNIRARAELYEGEFFLDASEGGGFRCEVTLFEPV